MTSPSLVTGENHDKLLDEIEQNIAHKGFQKWAAALGICEKRGLTDRRVREFLQKCLEKIVATSLEETDGSDSNRDETLVRASKLIGRALASDFSPWAAKCVVCLIPQSNAAIPAVFREVVDTQGASAFSKPGQHQLNDLLIQCAELVSTNVREVLQDLELRAIIFTWCQENQLNALLAVLRACNVHEKRQLDIAGSTLQSLAQRLSKQLEEIKPDQVIAVLTEEGSHKQMSTVRFPLPLWLRWRAQRSPAYTSKGVFVSFNVSSASNCVKK